MCLPLLCVQCTYCTLMYILYINVTPKTLLYENLTEHWCCELSTNKRPISTGFIKDQLIECYTYKNTDLQTNDRKFCFF